MKRSIRTIGVLLAAMLALSGTASAGGPADPFKGSWRSIDVIDDSNQKLAFGGSGSTRKAKLHDDFATSCGIGSATATGVGTITSATTISVDYHVVCRATGEEFDVTGLVYEHDLLTNTLTDFDGTVWSRPGA